MHLLTRNFVGHVLFTVRGHLAHFVHADGHGSLVQRLIVEHGYRKMSQGRTHSNTRVGQRTKTYTHFSTSSATSNLYKVTIIVRIQSIPKANL